MSNQIGALVLVAIIWPVWIFNLWMLFVHEIVYVRKAGGLGVAAQTVSKKDQPVKFWASACVGLAILFGVAGLATFVFFFR